MAAHAEHKKFLIGTEAVLEHTHKPENLTSVPLEGHDSINHMLQHARAGQRAILGHMSHNDPRHAEAPAGLNEERGHGLNLAHVARQPFGLKAGHGLNRVKDKKRRFLLLHAGDDLLDGGRGHGHKPGIEQAEPFGAGPDLRQGFLSRSVEHLLPAR